MPVTDQFLRLPLGSIIVDRDVRQRKQINTKNLLESIRVRGVINPVIVEPLGQDTYRLVAGERRLEASRELGLPDIPARLLADLDQIESQIIELEENIKRQDLHWLEYCFAVQTIHQLFSGRSPDWTQVATGGSIGLSLGLVSLYLRIAKEFSPGGSLVGKEATWGSAREAYNFLLRKDAREQGEAAQGIIDDIDGLVGPAEQQAEAAAEAAAEVAGQVTVTAPGTDTAASNQTVWAGPAARPPARPAVRPPESILHESFVQWAPKYSGPKFNLIHCDFPYGIKLFDGPQSGGSRHADYDDSEDVYWRLLGCLLDNIDRLMARSSHLVFWFSEKHGDRTRQAFREANQKLIELNSPPLVFVTHPLIWLKSDNTGIAADSKMTPRHVYETALMAVRGARQIVRIVGDAYSAPTDRKLHPSAKPEPVLRHFFSMLVDEHTRLLDPTCGSGSALRAAESLGASAVLGMDIDEQTVGLARQALRSSRALRAGASAVGL